MSMDSIDIGPVPPEENCQQVGTAGYDPQLARQECRAYIALLRRVLGDEPSGARLVIKSNPHDYGNYLEVVCKYDDNNETAVDYAFKCESSGPAEWDHIARVELGLVTR